MERVLNQEEIDAMVQATRTKGGNGDTPEERSIKRCSFRQSGQLTGEQTRALTALHEAFARNLSLSLGAYLRISFETALTSVDQVTYGEFLEQIPEITYLVSFNVRQMNTAAAMQIDHSVVFPIVDVLLGGTGHCEAITRE